MTPPSVVSPASADTAAADSSKISSGLLNWRVSTSNTVTRCSASTFEPRRWSRPDASGEDNALGELWTWASTPSRPGTQQLAERDSWHQGSPRAGPLGSCLAPAGSHHPGAAPFVLRPGQGDILTFAQTACRSHPRSSSAVWSSSLRKLRWRRLEAMSVLWACADIDDATGAHLGRVALDRAGHAAGPATAASSGPLG